MCLPGSDRSVSGGVIAGKPHSPLCGRLHVPTNFNQIGGLWRGYDCRPGQPHPVFQRALIVNGRLHHVVLTHKMTVAIRDWFGGQTVPQSRTQVTKCNRLEFNVRANTHGVDSHSGCRRLATLPEALANITTSDRLDIRVRSVETVVCTRWLP